MEHPKQDRYKTDPNDTRDYLDKFFESNTEDEVRGAMKFTINKYRDRLGKKDAVVVELTKIHDYIGRYLKYLKTIASSNMQNDVSIRTLEDELAHAAKLINDQKR